MTSSRWSFRSSIAMRADRVIAGAAVRLISNLPRADDADHRVAPKQAAQRRQFPIALKPRRNRHGSLGACNRDFHDHHARWTCTGIPVRGAHPVGQGRPVIVTLTRRIAVSVALLLLPACAWAQPDRLGGRHGVSYNHLSC